MPAQWLNGWQKDLVLSFVKRGAISHTSNSQGKLEFPIQPFTAWKWLIRM